jgi:protein-tyrosine phosphatase
LQEPGEHPYCGDGIHKSSGLSYLPSEFYSHGIKFYNFGWRDHETTNLNIILKIIKCMDICISEGKKVAVHCHAGRGRTGLIICAYLIYKYSYTADKAVEEFKRSRTGKALTKRQQILTLKKFEQCKVIF